LSSGLASILFALGLIGSGFLAVPVLTGSSDMRSANIRLECGLDEKFRGAPRFLRHHYRFDTCGNADQLSEIQPVTALFWTAVVNAYSLLRAHNDHAGVQ